VTEPTVWDGFTFFNEFDVLEIRLHELDSVVDRFILVEATRTFSGKPKPLFFQENRARFETFLPKIVHVVVDDLPDEVPTWGREAFQRDAILRGLGGAFPDDVVLIGDVDEIPRASAVQYFVDGGFEAAVTFQNTYYWRLNFQNVKGAAHDPLTVLVRRRLLGTPQEARLARFGLPGLGGAGWHFSYLGDEDAIRRKIDAFSHQEFNKPEFTERVRERLERGEDLFGRPGFEWKVVPVDETFPAWVGANRERFASLIAEGIGSTRGTP
jgi:hypothetical protein